MKKLLTLLLVLVLGLGLSGCGSKNSDSISIAVPNDTTNEARALTILENNGIIKLKDGAGITATKNDIVDNPYNVEIVEVEAAQIPNVLKDVDFAVINSNYAIDAINKYGAFKGSLLSIWRILRCNPFSKGGIDNVK